jgi:AraC-like DNA-binding protein
MLRHAMFAHMPIIREIIYGAVRRGVRLKGLLESSGLNQSQLQNSELHVPFVQAQNVWKYAVNLSEDPLLGLHIGEDTTPSIVGLTGYLMQTSPDLKTAFQQVCSFNQLFTDMFFYQLKESKAEIVLEYKPAARWSTLYPATAMQAVDQALSGTLNVFELLSGKTIKPIKVEITARSRKHLTEYERVLEAPVILNANTNRLFFKKDQLAQPVLSYDKKLFSVFNDLLTQQRRVEKSNPLSQEINRLLREVYQFKAPTLAAIAVQLNTVPRTLQRKLVQEGTSYSKLVSEMRHELSKEILKISGSKIKTIAEMLGYSEPSAFRRAFKTWTKKSPKEFRHG